MTAITEPMLAAKDVDPKTISYPVYATPKLDGIRVLKVDGEIVSRKFIKIPNLHIQKLLRNVLPEGIDGEIMAATGDFHRIQSFVTTIDTEPDFVYNAFDYVRNSLDKGYRERIKDLREWYETKYKEALKREKDNIGKTFPKVKLVLPIAIRAPKELEDYMDECLENGYEGLIIRSPDGPYKCGRATLKQGWMTKYKRFFDDEAELIGFTELMHNENDAEENAFGRTKRSSKKEGKVESGMMGALLLRWKNPNGQVVEFKLGTGFSHEEREEIFNNKSKYKDKIVKFRWQKLGSQGRPMFLSFLGFRDPIDT